MNGISKFLGWLAVVLFLYGFWVGAVWVCFYLGQIIAR